MTSRTEIDQSLALIESAKQRLSYQRGAVAKLRFDVDPRAAGITRDMEASMEAKLALLVAHHARLLAGLPTDPSIQGGVR